MFHIFRARRAVEPAKLPERKSMLLTTLDPQTALRLGETGATQDIIDLLVKRGA
jgi:hypothetical protein